MSGDETKTRRYSEEEFALILRRAAEMRDVPREAESSGRRGGFSLEEMQSIAREVGIDPGAVSRAAALMDTVRAGGGGGWAQTVFGGPSIFHFDLEVPGRLDAQELRRLLDVIRREASQQGTATEILGGVEWKSTGGVSEVSVNLSPRGNATAVQVLGDRRGVGFLTYFFMLIGAGFSTAVLGSVLEPTNTGGIIALVTGMLGSGFLGARGLWVWTGGRFRARLTRLVEALSAEIEGRALLAPPSETGSPRDA